MIQLLSRIIPVNTVNLLGVFRTEGGDVFHLLPMQRRKNSLKAGQPQAFDDLHSLLRAIDLRRPCVIVVDGKGILNKKTDFNNPTDIQWRKNLDFGSIFFTEYRTSTASFMSFSRRQPIEELLEQLRSHKLEIIDFYIGPLPAAFLKSHIASDIIPSGRTLLHFEDGDLAAIEKENGDERRTFELQGQRLTPNEVTLYGAAIDFFVRQRAMTKSELAVPVREEHIYRRAFFLTGKALLAFFFGALLLSYIAIQFLSARNAELAQQRAYSGQTMEKLKSLEAERAQKLGILSGTGRLSKQFLSFYVQELARSAPDGIRLDALDVLPLEKETRKNDKLRFGLHTITLSGTTATGAEFNGWMTSLRKMKWIKNFEILHFAKDKKDVQHFNVRILLDDV